MNRHLATALFALSCLAADGPDKGAMTALPGFVPMYWDAKQGKLYLEIKDFGKEFLYVASLPAGVGSNDIGLDRGQISAERVVRFERSGPRVLLVQPNYDYRAVTNDAEERRAVEESFAQSVLWGFKVESESAGGVLVDATAFFLRDAHGVIGRMKAAKQGTFRLDDSRSAFYLARTKGFPRNTEVETTLTFTTDEPGNFVQDVTPAPNAVTVRQHHSLVSLPEPGYRPRLFDPRAGYQYISYMDYATPIAESIRKRYLIRHRLTPDKPIVYYLDRSTPEPIRSALLEGARWWTEAFTAAGFPNGYRVEMMPEGADPMDLRYNFIQWVHRATRGWSYGTSVVDPRTGEILKGHVTLGSLRVRQDFLIAEGLLAPYEKGKPVSPEMEKMALARLRQLSAHEVGHTLGLSHNYVSSAAERASVMDYPHPLALLTSTGAPDLSKAYTTGVGAWDKVAIEYGYREFPDANETAGLQKILESAHAKGLYFLSDQDARPPGSAHPSAHLWDNGANAVDELERIIGVRKRALDRFGEQNIREGAPMSTLEEVLVPLYLSHRYQTEAAAKVIGGLEYSYALRGDGQTVTGMVPASLQKRALATLLGTLHPDFLALPERIIKLIPPRPMGYPRTREDFHSRTGLTFDPVTAAEQSAHLTLGLLLHPERAARLVEHSARHAGQPKLEDVVDAVMSAAFRGSAAGLGGEIQRRVDTVMLYHLMRLAAAGEASPQVRAVAMSRLRSLRKRLESAPAQESAQEAHYRAAAASIDRFEKDPKEPTVSRPADPPPGQPI